MSLIHESSSNQTEFILSPSSSITTSNDNKNNVNIIPSPQLKEVDLTKYSITQLTDFYHQTLYLIYLLYHLCHLIHGDLSEYNLLLHQSREIYLIDFGQSVDISHPTAYEYLFRDIKTINDYFSKCGVAILTIEKIISLIIEENKSKGSNHQGKEQEELNRNNNKILK